MALESFKCFYTPCTSNLHHLRDLVNHMRSDHSLESLSFVCGIDGCQHTYHSVSTFRKHAMYSHSIRWNADKVRVDPSSPPIFASSEVGTSTSENACSSEEIVDQDENHTREGETSITPVNECSSEQGVHNSLDNQQDKYTNLIQAVSKQYLSLQLRLCYDFNLPDWKADLILDSVSDLLKLVKNGVGQCLSASRVGDVLSSEDVFILRDDASLNSVLKMTPAQEKLVLKQLGYIEPEEIVFSTDSDVKKECGHYIPVDKTLTSYLSRPDVYNSIKREQGQSRTGILHSVSSGGIMSKHTVFSRNRLAIRLKVYTDEFQIGNPFRNVKKHSVSCVYFSVDNIERHLSGKSKHTHLAFLVLEFILKKYSKDVVWGRLLQDLRRLEHDGLEIEVNGVKEKIDVGVAVVCGDSKSLCDLGGYSCCFSSGKVCRKYLVEFTDLLQVRNESQSIRRTVRNHNNHVQEVLADGSNDKQSSRAYGVTGPSPFSVVECFHPVTSLPSDIMHDCYEGQMPFNIKAVVNGLVQDGVLSMKVINSLLRDFKYAECDKDNKFPGFPTNFPSKSASFPGTAAEKRNLFRMFTLIIGPAVPPNNKYWILHLKLQEICDILLAPYMKTEWIPMLSELVDEYITLWSELPKPVVGTIKPKGHYLVHMGTQSRFLGPPRNVACMGFEHFHLDFKKVASTMNNFRNPTLTMASAFQKKRCLEYSTSDICSSCDIKSAQCNVAIDSLSVLEKNALMRFCVEGDAVLLSVSKVKVKGRYFDKGAYVIVDINHENVPIFLKIVSIYRYVEQWLVYGKLTFPDRWCEHLHAFEVKIDDDDDDYVCVSFSEVVPLQTLSLYKVNGKCYLKLRHWPVVPL